MAFNQPLFFISTKEIDRKVGQMSMENSRTEKIEKNFPVFWNHFSRLFRGCRKRWYRCRPEIRTLPFCRTPHFCKNDLLARPNLSHCTSKVIYFQICNSLNKETRVERVPEQRPINVSQILIPRPVRKNNQKLGSQLPESRSRRPTKFSIKATGKTRRITIGN